ncbi:PhoP family transcriptional regulator [Calderihabitans maritimus]|uniref:Stage 0 sporulation protein A homolog n=2 Tax=Calderihabitans maritimus TaxID=1246530 RepID=A0A1Z5HRS9_9FIRM|nr:PhoP family transcriptional regulator [Calderihabitans maritimus]
MKPTPKIMVVDDDENICELVRLYLTKENFEVVVVHDGLTALEKIEEEVPSLVILDIMMPGMDGWEVCREIRKMSNLPIIMLSAKGESFDKILGLELGSDDYVVKPFDPKELVARVKAVLRRYESPRTERKQVIYPQLVINLNEYTVKVDGKEVELAPKEIELLYFLASHPNKVFNREQLIEKVWGYDYLGDTRTIDVHVKRLRAKLGSNPHWQIKTVWGVGYKFEVN